MSRRLAAAAALVLTTLVAVPAAAADGPMPFASQGGAGVLTPDGKTRYVTVGNGASTALQQIQVKGGAVQGFAELPGSWGVPVTTYSQDGEGLAADGKTLVLGDTMAVYPRMTSEFLMVNLRGMQVLRTIELKGDFAFDAISPDARRLYLIQHVDTMNTNQRYVVRGYDLATGRLLPGRIADRTQKSWVMQGYPMARATSAGGRWVYTLYENPGGYPFVHALDTVRGVAHCIGLPWQGSQNGFYNMRVSLRNNDRTLAVHWLSGRPWLAVDTSTWRISHDHRAGLPWLGIGAGGAATLAAAAALLLLRRRRRAEELEQELNELLRRPEGTFSGRTG